MREYNEVKLQVKRVEFGIEKPHPLEDLVKMLVRIYDHVNFNTPIEILAAHFQEEMGEVAEILNDSIDRKADLHKQKLEDEIADVFVWLIALLVKLDYLLGAGVQYSKSKMSEYAYVDDNQSAGLKFAEVLWDTFKVKGKNQLCDPRTHQRPVQPENH